MIRRFCLVVAVSAVLLSALPGPTQGQEQARQPAGPEWASVDGWGAFVKNGCAKCHSLRGVGGGRGPDLAALPEQTGFFELAAAVWNHAPRMGAQMWAAGVERQVTPSELSALLAFVFTAQYLDVSGDRGAGERLFSTKGCAGCHTLGDQGGQGRPALDRLKRLNSPILLSAAMWNHGTVTVARSRLDAGDLQHIVAYIARSARTTGAVTMPLLADTPARGRQIFQDKGCAGCHRLESRLSAGRRVSLAGFAERMWNHTSAVRAAGQRDAGPAQHVTGQDMAALVGHFFASRYFDTQQGDGRRGQQLIVDKGCLSCHAIYGRGADSAPDLATSNVVSSVEGQLAAMWNHGRLMTTSARRRTVPLRELTGQEVADIATYLGGVAKGPARSR